MPSSLLVEKTAAKKTVPLPARDRYWQTAVLGIQPYFMADDLWNRRLSDADRRRLGGNLKEAYKAYGTAGMWMRLRGVSRFRAVVEVAVALNVLDAQTGRWLLFNLGEATGDGVADMESAIEAGMLVLAEEPREIYWRQNRIEFDWYKHLA